MTVPPGVLIILPSLLLRCKSGAAVTGVVSLLVLSAGVGSLPFVPSSLTTALLAIWAMPAGIGLSTVTANKTLLSSPAATLPIVKVQTVPAGDPSAQLQPA